MDETRATQPDTGKQIERQRWTLLRRIAGQPVSAAAFTAPIDGLIELVGIATLPDFRRRGIATALTDYALRVAFASGVELACLSAADANAGRVYERVGFRSLATMLAYSDARPA
jgi:predicted GNAT family acetyltransferase